ncbi:restriction endonuclease subunit S [uncultured Phenylobacterium sp.]|uniref:restriction endonuclease subunit S n=1 Tax=uncultured Phenylobacterium sp. TaxID=349273 RepID=UPI0025F7CBDC|nr:restriction endonuclease subunit S [uncultured Phenylobacterium sp.]
MNAERLLAYYERIADAPEAIERLREFILDLAMQGKLVEHDPPNLAARNALTAARRFLEDKAGQTGRLRWKPSSEVLPSEVRRDVPPGWIAARVNDTGLYINGLAFKPSDWKSSGIPIIRIQNLTDPSKEFNYAAGDFPDEVMVRPGDVLVSWSATLDAFVWQRGDGVLNQHIFRVIPAEGLTEPRFLHLLLHRAIREMAASEHAHGLAMMHINRGPFMAHVVLIPSLTEQHRIVAKVDELMALCDQLAAARAARETARDRLAVASLARLNIPDPDTFADDASFALEALPALTTRADQIKQLRQTILNLAVAGKLVPQNPNDEPASELLKRIATKHESSVEIDHPEELGELPPSWLAVPLISLGSWAIGCGFPKNEQGLNKGPHFFLKVSDMNLPGNEKFISTANNLIDDEAARRMRAKIHPAGTIIFPKIGGAIATNKRRVLTKGSAIDNNCLGITFSTELDCEWAYLLLTTLDFTKYQVGTAVPALQQGVLERIAVGLPPVAEQHRIVAKVDELMALCDRLEASLAAAAATRRRLLDTLLAEALAPAEAREMELA